MNSPPPAPYARAPDGIAYIQDWKLHFPSGLFADLTEGHGCLGLNPNSLKTSGYDVSGGSPGSPNCLTDGDMIAFADLMIAGWQKMRDKSREAQRTRDRPGPPPPELDRLEQEANGSDAPLIMLDRALIRALLRYVRRLEREVVG